MHSRKNSITPYPVFERIACTQPGQWLYLFGSEGGVVYSEAHNRYAGLDAAGVAAYLTFDTEASSPQMTPGGHAGLAADSAIRSIHALAMGVFPPVESQAEWPALNPQASSALRGESLELGGISISIEFPTGPAEELCRAPFRGCRHTQIPPRCHLSAQRTERGLAIFVNGQSWMPLAREEQLGLGFLHAARAALYELGNYDAAFHASMVAREHCGILLCAPRESGKSTLTAYLSAMGFDFLADEPTLLRFDSCSVQPLSLPISLKAGSWSPLMPVYPQLADTPVHTRSDSMAIRLLLPEENLIARRPRRLTHIVFPRYFPNATTQLEPVPPLRALSLLHAGGMLLAPAGTQKTFEVFLNTLCEIPAFRLSFSSLAEAENLLRALE